MKSEAKPYSTVWLIAGSAMLCGALIWSGLRWAGVLAGVEIGPADASFLGRLQIPQTPARAWNPFVELLKLVAAAMVGMVVTGIHRRCRRKKKLSRSLAQSQVLLCISGALMMIIISDSLARAFGIAGAASIVRFRTPVKDPKDTTILFLLIGLGMACGLGAFAVAGLGTIFLCVMLYVLDRMGGPEERKQRAMVLELVSEGSEFPAEYVQDILARYRIVFEPREVVHGEEAARKYYVTLDPGTSLNEVNAQLIGDGASGIKSVAWERAKKRA